jgi:hypothetical protein
MNKDSAGALCDRSHRYIRDSIGWDKVAEQKAGFFRDPEFKEKMEKDLKEKGEWRF